MATRHRRSWALSVQFSEKSGKAAPVRRTISLLTVCALPILVLGCLPEDQNGRAGGNAPASNVAAKENRLDIEGIPASADVRVETTASVIPTSAPDTGAAPTLAAPSVPIGQALGGFFEALAALDRGARQEPVTILHLGDQHIAADRITAELRAQFQARFGDAGRGLMAPGVFRVANARINREGDWHVASSAAGDSGPFGLTGVRMSGRNGATLGLDMPTPFDWAEITFATGPNAGDAFVAVDGKGDVVTTRKATETWQRIKINAAGKKLSVRAEGEAPVRLLSWRVVRDAAGVRYINLGVPGATVWTPNAWTDAFVKAELGHLAPDLIVFGYGTNAAFNDALEPGAYAEAAGAAIDRLRAGAPNASFLVIGPPDVARLPEHAGRESTDACRALTVEERATYADMLRTENPRLARWHPPLKLRAVRRALQLAANQRGAFFWDWSETMGGPCSIHTWVHTTPPLAAADHRNFTAEGAKTTARALFQDIMRGFEQHRARVVEVKN